jgi:hypothetical protein
LRRFIHGRLGAPSGIFQITAKFVILSAAKNPRIRPRYRLRRCGFFAALSRNDAAEKKSPSFRFKDSVVFVGSPLADALALASELTYPDFNCLVPA